MKIFSYFTTNRVLRARIAGLEARLQDQEDKTFAAHQKHKAATKECARMAQKIHEITIRQRQLHNAADTLAKHTTNSIEANRAKAHWLSIR